jgi:hypothetical protein
VIDDIQKETGFGELWPHKGEGVEEKAEVADGQGGNGGVREFDELEMADDRVGWRRRREMVADVGHVEVGKRPVEIERFVREEAVEGRREVDRRRKGRKRGEGGRRLFGSEFAFAAVLGIAGWLADDLRNGRKSEFHVWSEIGTRSFLFELPIVVL